MRIKRQRRKLRGKYSGNCLSCAAKWSKCWYIASVDNQREWQLRLSKEVTPAADEVCFQCWDAKIRTSPKRKMHYKEERSVDDTNSPENTNISNTPYLRPAKRVDRNKRRVLNEDYTKLKDDGFEELEEFIDENDVISSDVSEESVILDEEAAVILLSTAFRTIPHMGELNIIKIDASFSEDESTDFTNESLEEMKSRKRGAYYCGKCGKLKKGHICYDHQSESLDQLDQADQLDHSPVISPPVSPPLQLANTPTFQLLSSLIPSVLAQPVVS